jgi:hypothetical protein
MVTKAEMADVLEKAADLYESEQVEWCRQTWGGMVPGVGMTACASSALANAVGLDHFYAQSLELRVMAGISDGLSGPARLYMKTRQHVDRALGQNLPAWNDEEKVVPVLVGPVFKGSDSYAVSRAVSLRSKEQVIDLFKELAKDLRNEE